MFARSLKNVADERIFAEGARTVYVSKPKIPSEIKKNGGHGTEVGGAIDSPRFSNYVDAHVEKPE